MPTNRTKRTRAKQTLDYWRLDQLATGSFLLGGVGYLSEFPFRGGINTWTGEELDELRERVRADWQRVGADFMAWWRGETERFSAAYASVGGNVRDPAVTPWALTEFGEPKQ